MAAMTTETRRQFKQWLRTRPRAVREVAKKYPPGTRFRIHGKIMHVISYYGSGAVSVTDIDPDEDYDKALANRQPVCPCCIHKLDVNRLA